MLDKLAVVEEINDACVQLKYELEYSAYIERSDSFSCLNLRVNEHLFERYWIFLRTALRQGNIHTDTKTVEVIGLFDD